MTEFIGARISLISKSNIRYVGTLHEINSETSTVALEQVTSHGTEGRRDGVDEITGSSNVYEYIVFRGSDVKDLRIEEQPVKKPMQLDDPAILGQARPTYAQHPPAQFQQPPPAYFYPPPPAMQAQQRYPYQAGNMFGTYNHPAGGQQPLGQPAIPPQPPQVPQQPPQQPPQPQQVPQQPPQPQQPQQPQSAQPPSGPQNRAPPQAPIGPSASRQVSANYDRQPQGPPQASTPQIQEPLTAPAANVDSSSVQPQNVASPSVQSRADGSANLAAPNATGSSTQIPTKAPAGPKPRGGIVPALPLTSPARPSAVPVSTSTPSSNDTASVTNKNDTNAAVRDLADKVNQLAVNAGASQKANETEPMTPASDAATSTGTRQARSRQPGTGSFVANRGRGGYRGGYNHQNRKVEVPTTDFDFQSNNEKFNKHDLVKEAIAGGPDENVPHMGSNGVGSSGETKKDGTGDIVIPPVPKDGFYNRQSSFFDNISCENKERAEAVPGERRGGAQFRSEEQKKNLETFGQGSVDGYSGDRKSVV